MRFALPALGLHATAIDPLGDLVFGLGVLNTLAAVAPEVADAPARRFPIVPAAACEEKGERENK